MVHLTGDACNAKHKSGPNKEIVFPQIRSWLYFGKREPNLKKQDNGVAWCLLNLIKLKVVIS